MATRKKTTERVVINPDGSASLETVTSTPVMGVTDALEASMRAAITVLPRLTRDSMMVMQPNGATYVKLLTGLRLDTTWALFTPESSAPYISPYFYSSLKEGDKMILQPMREVLWKPPEDMELLVVITKLEIPSRAKKRILEKGEAETRGTEGNSRMGLLAVDKETKKVYKLPIPNIYENGTLCTGGIQKDAENYPMRTGELMATTWQCNTWNTDLFGSSETRHNDLIRLSEDGKSSLPPEGKWQDLCPPMATAAWLDNAVLTAILEAL